MGRRRLSNARFLRYLITAYTAPFLDLGAIKTMRPSGGDRVAYESAAAVELRVELGGGVVLHIARH